MTFSKDEMPPMVPSAEERANRLTEQMAVTFGRGIIRLHGPPKFATRAIDLAYRDGFALGSARAERMLAALREPSDELVETATLATCFLSAGKSCLCKEPRDCWNIDDLSRAEIRAAIHAAHDMLKEVK